MSLQIYCHGPRATLRRNTPDGCEFLRRIFMNDSQRAECIGAEGETSCRIGAKANGADVEHGIQVALEAILISPHFLFRIEHDPNPTDPSMVHKVSDVELASRLSYFLWRSMPDDELLGLAERNKLHETAVLDAQVKRMLADRRSISLADNFAGQWLELRNLDVVKPDQDRFLYWGPQLRDAMKMETRLFFNYILRENRPLAAV